VSSPSSIPCYIALICQTALEPPVIKGWYACVCTAAPSGTVFTTSVSDDSGMPRPVSLVHRQDGTTHTYTIPLTRDLTPPEAETVFQAFANKHPDLDFDATISTPMPTPPEETDEGLAVDQQAFASLCDAWAKRQHENWVRDRTENGWRYGPSLSLISKTHPLLLPWEHLPAHYRKVDMEQPQGLLDLLNAQGYAVITKTELDALLKLARGAA
jgi:hypothetical protein